MRPGGITVREHCEAYTAHGRDFRPSQGSRRGGRPGLPGAVGRLASLGSGGLLGGSGTRLVRRLRCGGTLAGRPAELPGVEERVFAGSTGEVEGGWQLPVRPRFVVDRDYVLAAAGLLLARHPEAAYRLVRRLAGLSGQDH